MRPFDARLLRHAGAARGYLAMTVGLGLAGTGLILLQAGLLARLLATAADGTGPTVLGASLAGLAVVLAGRAAAVAGGEVTALRAAAMVKSGLRRQLTRHAVALGPGWLGGQQAGEITTLATRGLDGLDAYFARYLPQLVLAVAVPLAVLVRVAFADWISAVIIGVTLPLIPVFAVLIGLHTKAQTQRQWQLLARLGGHFLDVVAGLPTLKVFGRAKAQAEVIKEVTGAHRAATMATLRVAFLSALVLELAAALATALVAVEVGLRLLAGHVSYQTALLVLLLTPEAYLPLRNVGAQFHASTEGATAAQRAFEILDTPIAHAGTAPARAADVDLRTEEIRLTGVSLVYPGREQPALDNVSLTIRPGERITLTGRSGAGKSSLLALLLRFTEPTAGSISAGCHDLVRYRPTAGCARLPGSRSTRICSPPRSPTTSPWASPARRVTRSRPPAGWPARTTSSSGCPRVTTPSWPRAPGTCRPGSARRSPWPARSSAMRRCCSWTSPPPTSTRPARSSSRRRSTPRWPAVPSSSSPIAGPGPLATAGESGTWSWTVAGSARRPMSARQQATGAAWRCGHDRSEPDQHGEPGQHGRQA